VNQSNMFLLFVRLRLIQKWQIREDSFIFSIWVDYIRLILIVCLYWKLPTWFPIHSNFPSSFYYYFQQPPLPLPFNDFYLNLRATFQFIPSLHFLCVPIPTFSPLSSLKGASVNIGSGKCTTTTGSVVFICRRSSSKSTT